MASQIGPWLRRTLATVLTGLALGGCAAEPAPGPQEPPTAPTAPSAPAKPAPVAVPEAVPATPAAKPGVAQYWPTGRRESSAIAVERVAPAAVSVGQSFESILRVTNLTGGPLENVVVTETPDAGLTVLGSVPPGRAQEGALVFALGTLGAGETKEISITGSGAAGGTTLSSCAAVAYTLPLCVRTRVVQPALGITAAITPESVLNCEPIAMTVEVTNLGLETVRDLRIEDALPAGLTTAEGASAVAIAGGDLAGGEKRSFEVRLKAGRTGTFETAPTVTSEGGLRSEGAKVTTVVRQPMLNISCRPGSEEAVLGTDSTFTLTVRNSGDAPCLDTTITAALPNGTTFRGADHGGTATGSGVVWPLGTLPAGSEISVKVTVAAQAAGGLPISATVACRCATPASTSCQVAYVGIPAMQLETSHSPEAVQVGDNMVCTLTLTNSGLADLTGVQLSCSLDEVTLMQYVNCTGGGTANGQTVTFPAVSVLKPGEKQTCTVTVRAAGAGQAKLKVEALCKEIPKPQGRTETATFRK